MIDTMLDWLDELGPAIAAIVIIAIVGGCIWLAVGDDDAFAKHCSSLGGHVKDVSSTGVGVAANGKTVVTTSTIEFCLSGDGRILDTH